MPAVKLSFGEIVSEGFGFFFTHLRLFFHLVTIPVDHLDRIRIVGATIAEDP